MKPRKNPAAALSANKPAPETIPAPEEAPVPEGDAPILEDDAPAPEPPSLETVHAWLAMVKPAAVLGLLKEPDFAYMAANAFAGARVNAGSFGLPHVRRRLAQEVIKNEWFTEKLHALAEAAAALPEPPAPTSSAPAPPPAADLSHAAEREQWKLERERNKGFRAERDTARAALAETEAARQQAAHGQQIAEAARAEADALAQEQVRKSVRLERRLAQIQQENTELAAARNALARTAKAASAPTKEKTAPPAAQPQISPWQIAAAHVLDRGKADAALILADEVLRLTPGDPAALGIAAQASEARHEPMQAAEYVKLLLEQALAGRRTADAADLWLRLVRLTTPAHVEKSLRALLRALRPDDAAGVRQMRLALTRLQGLAPAAHAQAVEQITTLAAPALAEALMPLPGALTDDERLPLDLPFATTVAQMLAAVRAGDEHVVTDARESLERLAVSGRDEFERVRTALVRAAGDDPSLLQPLLRAPRGAAVVDASNVAMHGQGDLVSPQPRLRSLLAMRRALLQRGFFPVVMIGDANLPHIVDEPPGLNEMRARREIQFVDGGHVADETLLREAKMRDAPLVTNDYMMDWDPQQHVVKIQFTFGLTGEILFAT